MDKSQKLLQISKKPRMNQLNMNKNNNKLMDSIESSESFISLPFEAQIGIKLLLSTLDSIDVKKDKIFSFKIIKSLLPHLNSFIMTLSKKYYSQNNNDNNNDVQNQDFGLLNRICNFLCSMINVLDDNIDDNNDDNDDNDYNDTNNLLSSILCIILALSIISNDFDTIIYVIHRILTNGRCQVCAIINILALSINYIYIYIYILL